ncbi:MAG: T9SS type A sorting domain-containing protein [Bacteroidota bacterium]
MKKIFFLMTALVISSITMGQTLLSESFDGATFPPTNWTATITQGTYNWTRVTSGTNPACTPHSGAAMARYNSYNASAGSKAILVTPLFDLSTVTPGTAIISFWIYRDNGYPTDVDRINIYANTTPDLTGATKIDSVYRSTGLYPIVTANGWYKYQYTIPATFTGASNYIILQAVSGYGNSMHIDDVSVFVPLNYDAGIILFNQPVSPVPAGVVNVSVTVKNFGLQNLTNASIAWKVDGVLQTPYAYTNPGLTQNTSEDSVVIGTYNFASTGFYQLIAWTENPNGNPDTENSNDTAVYTVFVQGYAVIPFSESFDGTWTDKYNNHDAPCEYWSGTPVTGNNSWRRDDDGTTAVWTSATTGGYTPAGAENTPHSARFHSYYASTGATGILDLYLDFTNPGTKVAKFWYINTDGSDSLDVYISTNGGLSFTFLNQYLTATAWTQYTVDLGSPTSGNVILRFKATSDYGDTDIGVDQVEVYILQPHDMKISAVLSPVTSLCGNANDSLLLVVQNIGTNDESNIPVYAEVNTPGGPVNFSDIIPGLTSGSSDTLFMGLVTTSTSGQYDIMAYTDLSSDAEHNNDTVNYTFFTQLPLSIPHIEDFESATPLANWNTSMITGNGHGNSSYVIYKNLYSTTNDTAIATMNLKTGPLTSNSYLSFDYRYTNWSDGTAYTLDQDTLGVFLSDDCGNTFYPVFVVDPANHAPTTYLTHIDVSLGMYAGSEVLLKFIASWGGSGDYYIDIDNIAISEPPVADLGPDAVICDSGTVTLDAGPSQPGYYYMYLWTTTLNPSPFANVQIITVDSVAIYIVMVFNGYGLSDADTVVVTQAASPVVSIGNDTTTCDTYIIDAGSGYDSYYWSTGETTQTITVDTSGIGFGTFNYWVEVTSGGCPASDTISVTFELCVGTDDYSVIPGISIFPNPATGLIHVVMTGFSNSILAIYDMQGSVVCAENINSNNSSVSIQLDLTYLPGGVYMVRLFDNKNIISGRLIIQ